MTVEHGVRDGGDTDAGSASKARPARVRRRARSKKGAQMNTEGEAAMQGASEFIPEPLDSLLAGITPAGEAIAPFEASLFGADEAPRRPVATIQKLKKRLESRSGLRGAQLAELVLRAGITLPARRRPVRGSQAVEAALWTELARENAILRREAERLMERQHSLSRRIQRAKTRVQDLRLKILQWRLGLTSKDLLDVPLLATVLQEAAPQRVKSSAGKDKG